MCQISADIIELPIIIGCRDASTSGNICALRPKLETLACFENRSKRFPGSTGGTSTTCIGACFFAALLMRDHVVIFLVQRTCQTRLRWQVEGPRLCAQQGSMHDTDGSRLDMLNRLTLNQGLDSTEHHNDDYHLIVARVPRKYWFATCSTRPQEVIRPAEPLDPQMFSANCGSNASFHLVLLLH